MPLKPNRSALWRRTPPAVFAPILGLFGLGLAWRRAAETFDIGPAPADMILGAVTFIYLCTIVSYAAKLIRRPAALLEDLRVLPGRAGLAAATLSAMALAAAAVPFAPAVARALLLAALSAHAALALLIIYVLAVGPAEQRRVTPAWHLTFVGFIVAPAAAIPLGMTGLTQAILGFTVAAAALIYGMSLVQLVRSVPPPPLRPLLAIHLAPPSLFGSAAFGLGWSGAATGFVLAASAILIVLLARLGPLLAAGFSPLWGAFTFPLAAYVSLLVALAGGEAMLDLRVIAAAALAAASVVIPLIAAKILQGWARGSLAAQTNAAIA